jgi:pimeloyl-ACP methyl ester carboxylesterase
MNTYFFSGLGADERVWQLLQLHSSITPVHVKWLLPTSAETLPEFAARMLGQIDCTQRFNLVGLSFGGMVVQEIAKHSLPNKVVLISTIPQANSLTALFRAINVLKLHKMAPHSIYGNANPVLYHYMGLTNQQDKALIKAILNDTPKPFIKHAINQLLNWQGAGNYNQAFSIHGSNDRLLPITNFSPKNVIQGGGHFLPITHHQAISNLLNNALVHK